MPFHIFKIKKLYGAIKIVSRSKSQLTENLAVQQVSL